MERGKGPPNLSSFSTLTLLRAERESPCNSQIQHEFAIIVAKTLSFRSQWKILMSMFEKGKGKSKSKREGKGKGKGEGQGQGQGQGQEVEVEVQVEVDGEGEGEGEGEEE